MTPAQFSMDVTERTRTEEALRASEARLAAGTELAGLGYYEVDYAERTCFMDDRFREICGVPPDLQMGLEPVAFWLEHIHPDDRQRVSAGRRVARGSRARGRALGCREETVNSDQ